MAVYVDKPLWRWRNKLWCHMVADTPTELHGFARKIGLRRIWFQDKARYPHYDLTEKRRAVALNMGAVEVLDKREFMLHVREFSKHYGF